jgi:hypothetical protein
MEITGFMETTPDTQYAVFECRQEKCDTADFEAELPSLLDFAEPRCRCGETAFLIELLD